MQNRKSKKITISFLNHLEDAKMVGQIMHLDLSDIIRVPNDLNVSYFGLIIDEYSRYIRVFLVSKLKGQRQRWLETF